MYSLFRLSLAILAFTFTSNIAHANQPEQVLADILSPDELAAEMGISQTPAEILASTRFADKNGRLHIVVDKARQGTSPTAQTMEVFLDGNLIKTLLISTGREKDELAKSGRTYFSSTPTGTFKIYRRTLKHWSSTWKAWMPYAQFFNGGIALHATSEDHYEELGTRASGGCVRMTLEDAKMIYELVDEVGVEQTRITVFKSEPQEIPVVVEEPVVTDAPVVVDQPVVVEEPVVVDQPATVRQ